MIQHLQPLCQAKHCSNIATDTIPSRHGHPTPVWSLCQDHFDAVEGRDPRDDQQKGWTLQKLHYKCIKCGHKVGHNAVTNVEDCPQCDAGESEV